MSFSGHNGLFSGLGVEEVSDILGEDEGNVLLADHSVTTLDTSESESHGSEGSSESLVTELLLGELGFGSNDSAFSFTTEEESELHRLEVHVLSVGIPPPESSDHLGGVTLGDLGLDEFPGQKSVLDL